MLRTIPLILAILSVLGGLAAAAWRVDHLLGSELEEASAWASLDQRKDAPGATRISRRLVEVPLRRDDHALFEVCFRDQLQASHWQDALKFLIWQPTTGRVELQVPLASRYLQVVKRDADGACLQLGGGVIERDGNYAVDAVFEGGTPAPEVRATAMRARVLARTPRGLPELLIVLSISLGGLAMLMHAFFSLGAAEPRAQELDPARPTPPWRPGLGILGVLLGVLLCAGVLLAPLQGPVGMLARGIGLSLVQVAVALAFARALGAGAPRAALRLERPAHRPLTMLGVAVICALLLNLVARLSVRLVPSTGEAPIETFISWPSGALAFAAIGMVVPLSEELFFRGFLFGLIEPWGKARAFAVTLFLFVAAHAHQTWGNWGALLGICCTGALCTGLRASTGSTLVPALAHLLYNLSLWVRF